MWARTTALVNDLRSRWNKLNEPSDAGYASEAVLVTALLILGAIVVITIIVTKITSKANDIDLGMLVLTIVAP